MISFQSTGDFRKTNLFLKRMSEGEIFKTLDKYGHEGVIALASMTPKETGITAESWNYEVEVTPRSASIIWGNSHIEEGRPIAVLLQYGHGTRNGGWVEGRDYINPALRPVFDRILLNVWREVTSA